MLRNLDVVVSALELQRDQSRCCLHASDLKVGVSGILAALGSHEKSPGDRVRQRAGPEIQHVAGRRRAMLGAFQAWSLSYQTAYGTCFCLAVYEHYVIFEFRFLAEHPHQALNAATDHLQLYRTTFWLTSRGRLCSTLANTTFATVS